MIVASTMWSRRPTAAGQSCSRTRICMPAITTPSAPRRLTSPSSARLASCRDPLTSSVQPATSMLPDHWRVWRAMVRSSCRDPIEMPSASPAGTQPALTSLAKSCPDRPEVKGAPCPCPAPGARTAVPMAVNSSPPSRKTSAAAGRPPRRARPARRTRRPSGRWPYAGPGTWPPPAGRTIPDRPALIPGSRAARAAPRRMIPAFRDSRTRGRRRPRRRRHRTPGRGSKPTPRIAANSCVVSADPHVPPGRAPASPAWATAGSSSLTSPA